MKKIFFSFNLIFFVVFNIIFISSAHAQNFLSKWGSIGSQDGQFLGPQDVAFDSGGNVYVADQGNHRVQKFYNNGEFILKWYTSGNPHGIAIDSQDNIYVVSISNNKIQKFKIISNQDICPNGTISTTQIGTEIVCLVSEWGTYGNDDGQFSSPNDVAIDSLGNVYVSDEGNYRIQKFSSNGDFITKWETLGFELSNQTFPQSLDVDSLNNVYVTTANLPRILKFSSNGDFITKWGSNSMTYNRYEDGRFTAATGIAIDSSNNVYVTDTYNGRIQKFSSDGVFITKWGTWGNENGQFNRVVGLDIGPMGNIYTVEDEENHRIQVFTPSTEQPQSFFSQVKKNASNSWNFRKTPGTKISGTQTDKSFDDVIKTVPNDWVLKVTNTTDANSANVDLDGYRWYQVEDVTDGATGWMAAKKLADGTEYLSYNASSQASFEAKANAILYQAKEARVPVILEAINTYHAQPNTLSSLYGGGGGFDGRNNFQTFIQGSIFPKELVVAIIGQESGIINFDNEGCATSLDGGIGIMQITSLDARGSGSNLKNYPKMGDCTAVSTSKYYSNAWQGIFANIKDGFRTLQDKFGYVRKTETVDNITAQEMKAISTVYRYNQGSPYKVQAVYEIWSGQSDDYVWNEYLKYIYKNRIRTATADSWMQKVRDICASETTLKNCLVKTESAGMTTSAFYLRDVGNKLHSSPFGASYQNPTYGDKLVATNNSRLVLFLRSPAELRVVNSAGEITGSVAGEHMEEIANSVYVPEQKFVTIFFPRDQYKYRVVGLETGKYGLSADFINNGDHTFFDADYIPTHAGEVHDYMIDWNKMSRCERGSVLLEVDYEGDGIVDRVVKGSCRLSDINPPAITISSPSGSYLLNATTAVQFTATDASGVETISATLNGVPVSNNQVLSFTKPGENIVEVSAMDTEGNTSTVMSTFNVLYTVNGFLQPIRLDGSGVYNQGMTLPVRFEARDANGKVVPSVSAQLYTAKVNGGVVGGDEIPISTTVSSTGNQFRYDVGGHMYIFNLSTDSMLPGIWQLKAVLDSGQEIKAKVQIKIK